MKNFQIILGLILLSFFFSCKENQDLNKTSVESIKEAVVQYRGGGSDFYIDDMDGYILIIHREYDNYDGNCTTSRGFTFSSKFGKPNGEDVGVIKVQERELSKIVENGSVRYRVEVQGDELADVFLQEEIRSDFETKMSDKYASFQKDLYFPAKMCFQTSIGARVVFPKDEDLVIDWETDRVIDDIYITICAAGSPCIVKKVPDNGHYVISKSEFSDFETGAYLLFYVGRGLGDVVTMDNGKRIGVIRASIANVPGLDVE